jgi:hypothetical protein
MERCPKCGIKHRTESGARRCATEVRNQWTFWVIVKQAGTGTIPEERRDKYEEDKALYTAMEKFMQQFNS